VMAAISPSSPTACRPLAKRLVFSTRVPKEVHSKPGQHLRYTSAEIK